MSSFGLNNRSRETYPGVSLRKLATTGSREPNLGSRGAFSAQFLRIMSEDRHMIGDRRLPEDLMCPDAL